MNKISHLLSHFFSHFSPFRIQLVIFFAFDNGMKKGMEKIPHIFLQYHLYLFARKSGTKKNAKRDEEIFVFRILFLLFSVQAVVDGTEGIKREMRKGIPIDTSFQGNYGLFSLYQKQQKNKENKSIPNSHFSPLLYFFTNRACSQYKKRNGEQHFQTKKNL